MRPWNNTGNIAQKLSWLALAIIALLPFHAFLTVWLSSLVGNYTLLRLWKEFLLAVLALGAIYILLLDKPLRRWLYGFWPARLIVAYAALMLAWGVVPLMLHNVTGKAMWYGLLADLRFLVFFMALLVLACKSSLLNNLWKGALIIPALVVAAFAVLQYLVLPYDFLRHFGYGPDTISPYETINHNVNRLRVASTMRGANPLGAYLLMPLTALAAAAFREKKRRANIYMMGIGLLLALAFSFSRSAWLGTLVSIGLVVWLSVNNPKLKRNLLLIAALVLVGAAGLTLALRNNSSFENVLYHTDHTSTIAESSNEGHSAAFKSAGKDIIHEPFGRGVGTAGPASTYNYGHYGRISENYFMQLGQEAGWPAMGLFIAICASVGWRLWRVRTDALGLWLLASLIGISLINLLSHAWTDDTLAYLWWGLAAIALAPRLKDT